MGTEFNHINKQFRQVCLPMGTLTRHWAICNYGLNQIFFITGRKKVYIFQLDNLVTNEQKVVTTRGIPIIDR